MPSDYTAWKPEYSKCGSCGKPAEELSRCVWDTRLMICKDCEVYIDNRCPDCGSDHLLFEEHDFGRCSQTGYQDAGVRAICEDCGCNCEERDTEVKIGPMTTIKPCRASELERKPAGMEQAIIHREARHGKA